MNRNVVKDWGKEHAFRDLFFSMPELKENEFISYLYQGNKEEEDEGERGLPTVIIKHEHVYKIPAHECHTDLSLPMLSSMRLNFILRRGKNER